MTTVPDLLAVQFENLTLRLQIVARQHADLERERQQLLSKMRVRMKATATAQYNPQTRQFVERPSVVKTG